MSVSALVLLPLAYNASAFSPEAKSMKKEFSPNTTRSGTPESTRKNSFDDENSSETQPQGFLIDVKPKRKVFNTAEEKSSYVNLCRMKLKTELCKNFELRGWCKFGDTCSFAHGKHELQEKKHLHEKYKTRPCKDFHSNGYCSYGLRCQYLHKEALGVNIFYEPSGRCLWNAERNNYRYQLLDEIWRMTNSNIRPERILEKIPGSGSRRRLLVFSAMTK